MKGISMKIQITNNPIIRLICIFSIISLPMMPIFTRNVYYIFNLISVVIASSVFILNKDKLTSLEKMMIVFIMLLIFSFTYSINLDRSKSLFTLILRIFLFSFAVIHLTYYYTGKNISKTISFITRTYLLATIAVTIYAFIFEFGKYRPNQRFGELLFNESYGTYIFYSYHLLICDCILLYKLVLQHKKMNKNERLSTLLFISILLIATFANGTRKLFAGIFIYTAFLYFIEYRKQLKKLIKYTTYVLILSIIGLLITFNVSSLYQTIGRRIESLFSYVQKEDIDISTYKRNQMMNLGWNLFTQHPILGIGANCYIEMNELYNNMQLYSHNNYLEIGVNQGILSLLVYYIWYFLVMYKLIVKLKKGEKVAVGFLSFLILELFLDIWTVSYSREQFILTYNLIALYAYGKNQNSRVENERGITYEP